MIYVGENKALLCKGDSRPAELYKGNKKIAGYTVTEFEGSGSVTLIDCYNDKVYDAVTNAESVTVRGKNIFDMSKATVTVGYYLDGNGGSSSNSTRLIKISPMSVEPSTTYTISSNLYFYTVWFFNDSTAISKITAYGVKKKTFTTPENCTRIRVSFDLSTSNQTSEGVSAFKWAMIEKGTGDGIYEPYIEPQTVSIENGEIMGVIPTFKGTTVIETNASVRGVYKKQEVKK